MLLGNALYAQSSDSTHSAKLEVPPIFPGGENAMMKYLSKQIRYPEADVKNNVGGRVVIQFVIDTLGKVGNVKVVKSVSPTLDAEAVRVVESMPNWVPGKQNGKLVPVQFTLPIRFNIENYMENKQQGLKGAEKWGMVVGVVVGAVLGYMLVSYLL